MVVAAVGNRLNGFPFNPTDHRAEATVLMKDRAKTKLHHQLEICLVEEAGDINSVGE